MLDFAFTNQFKKDLKLLEKRHYDIKAIFDIISMIIWQEPLPERCREHGLSGNYAGFMECHALNDCLLIYLSDGEKVTFSRAGTHSDLF
jgi:mRNA interferase YafQ